MLHRRQRNRARAFALAAAIAANVPFYVHAQTSGTWTFNSSANWSEAPRWFGSIPNGGGDATLIQNPAQASFFNITLDVPVTLNSLTFDSTYTYVIPTTGTNTLTLTGSGLIAVNRSPGSMPSAFPRAHRIERPIAGSVGAHVTGPGTVWFNTANTYTGGTSVANGATLQLITDAALGATGAGNDVTLSNGTLAVASVVSARGISITGGTTGTVHTNFDSTIGAVSGNGTFRKTGGFTLTLQGAGSFSGPVVHSGWNAGSMTFSGASGAMTSAASLDSSGVVTFDNASANVANRFNDAAPVTLRGGDVNLIGNAGAASSETIGATTTTSGMTTFTVAPGAGQNAALTAASWSRANRGGVLFRGTSLGASPGANVANIFLTSAPSVVGGGGSAGSTNISILRGAVGGTTTTDAGTSFVTYGATGVRPLSNAEYNANLAGAAATDNVRKTATEAVAGNVTVNALNVASTAGVTGPGTVTVTSGQVINSAVSASANTVNLEFGSAEGFMHMASSGSFTGVISGSNGLTKSGVGALRLGNANTYTGDTTILAGEVHLTGNVPANAPSAFGNSNAPVILQSGASSAALIFTGVNGVFDRPIIVRGNGNVVSRIGVGTNNEQPTWNGTIQLDSSMALQPEPSSFVPMTFNNVISGPGGIYDSIGRGQYHLNNINTYSGGTEMLRSSRFLMGTDAAFGTGPIHIASAALIGSTGGARTIANPIRMSFISGGAGNGIYASGTSRLTFTGDVDLGGGNTGRADLRYTLGLDQNATAPMTFTGVISNGGLIIAADVTLTGASTYGSGTSVTRELTILNTSGSATGFGPVTVTGGTLRGNGSIFGPVTIGGSFSEIIPGTDGTFGTIATGAMSSTTANWFDLGAPNLVGGPNSDLVAVNGDLFLSGSMHLTTKPGYGYGDYTLYTYTGALSGPGLSPPVNNVFFGYTLALDYSQPGKVILKVIPEPGTLGVLGIAAAGLVARRRRRA